MRRLFVSMKMKSVIAKNATAKSILLYTNSNRAGTLWNISKVKIPCARRYVCQLSREQTNKILLQNVGVFRKSTMVNFATVVRVHAPIIWHKSVNHFTTTITADCRCCFSVNEKYKILP